MTFPATLTRAFVPPVRRRAVRTAARTAAAMALSVLLVTLGACGDGDAGPAADTEPPGAGAADSSGGPPPVLPGITDPDLGQTVEGAQTEDSGGEASAPGPDPARAPGTEAGTDTIRATGPDSVRTRLDRLEAENDSLRAALGALLTTLSSDNIPLDSALALQAEPDSAQGLLAVGTENVQHWGLRIFAALVFIGLMVLTIRGIVWILDQLAERNAARRLLFKRLVPIARVLIWTLGLVFVVMVIFQVDTQGLVAAGAAIGVAVGFAAQDILKNVFGGFIVLFDQPFQVGDKISVGDSYGEVVSIGLRSTRLVTPDDNLVSVPNAQVVGGQVANANAGELNCQVVTDLWLPGGVDAVRARQIAFEAATSSRYLFRNKPVVVLVKDEFKETFLLHVVVKAYVLDPRLEFRFRSDVTERARAAFAEEGLIGPMHGARAWVDIERPEARRDAEAGGRTP